MRRIDRFCRTAVLASAALALSWGVAPAARAAETAPAAGVSVPKPVDFGSDLVNAAVILPNPARLIQRAEAVVRAFVPDEVQPGMLLAQAGEMLGDPDLAALDAGKPVVALVLASKDPNAPPPVVLMLSVKDAKPYEALLQAQGLAAKAADGLLLGALTPDALAAAEGFVPAYRKIAQDPGACDLRVYGSLERLLQAYGPMVYGMADTALGQLGALMALAPGAGAQGAGAMKMLRLEVKGLMALLGQMGELQLDLTLSADAVRVDAIATSKAGSALAGLLAAAPPARNPCLALLAAPAAMRGAFQFDGARLGAFATQLAGLFANDPDMKALLHPEFLESVTAMGTWFGGSTAMAMRAPDGKGMVNDTVMAVKDEAACLASMEKTMALFAPGGAWEQLYKDMGLPVSMALKKDARKHGVVPVHRFKISVQKAEGMTAEQLEQMQGMMKDMEFAFAKGYYLASQDAASLDALIDRAMGTGTTAAPELHAATVFGAGRHGYLDMDLVGILKAGMAMAGPAAAPAAGLFADVKPGEPMTMALTVGDGRALAQMRMPLATYIDMAKSAREASRQQLQGGTPQNPPPSAEVIPPPDPR